MLIEVEVSFLTVGGVPAVFVLGDPARVVVEGSLLAVGGDPAVVVVGVSTFWSCRLTANYSKNLLAPMLMFSLAVSKHSR